MTPLEWARSVKPDLVALQRRTGIPAIWAVSQMAHESASGGGLSDLATKAGNYGGLKWAEWQAAYGCLPITYGTWEEIDGQAVNLDDAFCRCPDGWSQWLTVYAALLTGDYYAPCLEYKADPFLYGGAVWAKGYATDSKYLAGRDSQGSITGVLPWMFRLWPDYADTLPSFVAKAPTGTPAKVFLPGMRDMAPGVVTADGQTWAQLEDGTWIPLRITAEAMDRKATWFGPGRGGPLAVVS